MKKKEKQLKNENRSIKQIKKEKGLLINFNKNLYNLKAIESAIEEYGSLADFSLRKVKNYIQVELNNIDKDVRKIIEDEFCNYVFFLMKSED